MDVIRPLKPDSSTVSPPADLAMRVLVVEDEPDLLRTIAQVLREDGYAVDEAVGWAGGICTKRRVGNTMHCPRSADAETDRLAGTGTIAEDTSHPGTHSYRPGWR